MNWKTTDTLDHDTLTRAGPNGGGGGGSKRCTVAGGSQLLRDGQRTREAQLGHPIRSLNACVSIRWGGPPMGAAAWLERPFRIHRGCI